MFTYDVAIIGAGAGGLNAAMEAISMGKKVVLVDKYKPGGECTWAGCIPSKALIQLADEIHTAKKYADIEVNGKQIMSKVRQLIKKAHQAEAVEQLQAAGIEYIQGDAKINDQHSIRVVDEIITAENIVIATGSRALIPSIKGIDQVNYLTNENVFQLEDLPKNLIVVGGGPIGVELTQAFQRLGVQVKLVEMADRILFREEKGLAHQLQSTLEEEGVQLYTSAKALEVKQVNGTTTLTIDRNDVLEKIEAGQILFALGRKPNIENIGLDDLGIRYTTKGIEVNEYNETSVRNIYAVGDVVGPYLFSHMAGFQAKQAMRHAFLEVHTPIEQQPAWCTFTHPELARTGMTENEAREKYQDNFNVYTVSYSELDRAVVDQKTTGEAKIICDQDGFIIGASILGERACELLGELQLLKTFHIPFRKLKDTIHPYPSYSEILTQLSNVATE